MRNATMPRSLAKATRKIVRTVSGDRHPTDAATRASSNRKNSRSPKRRDESHNNASSIVNPELLQQAIQASPLITQTPAAMTMDFYDINEIHVGKLLHSGDFYEWHSIKRLPGYDAASLSDNSEYHSDCDESKKRSSHKKKSKSKRSKSPKKDDKTVLDLSNPQQHPDDAQQPPPQQYVLKQFRNKKLKLKARSTLEQTAFLQLVLEAKYLARLCHDNLVLVKGMPLGEEAILTATSSSASGSNNPFFLITERVGITLQERLEQWKQYQGERRREVESLDPTGRYYRKKLSYAKELAQALQYLHERNLVVLNLCPQTIGFSVSGKVKITDLSCCRELSDVEQEHVSLEQPSWESTKPRKKLDLINDDDSETTHSHQSEEHDLEALRESLANVSETGAPRPLPLMIRAVSNANPISNATTTKHSDIPSPPAMQKAVSMGSAENHTVCYTSNFLKNNVHHPSGRRTPPRSTSSNGGRRSPLRSFSGSGGKRSPTRRPTDANTETDITDDSSKANNETSDNGANTKTNFLVSWATATDGHIPRYVAPEVIVRDQVTPTADSYSWALIVLELLTLSQPYGSHKAGQHVTKVCLEGQRPNTSFYKLNGDLEDLLHQSWRHTVEKRWDMARILQKLPAPRRRELSPRQQQQRRRGTTVEGRRKERDANSPPPSNRNAPVEISEPVAIASH